MKKYAFVVLVAFILQSCIVSQTKRLADCDFIFKEVQKIEANGVDVKNVKSLSDLNMGENLMLSKALLLQKLPVKINVLLEVQNNSKGKAVLSNTEWILLLKNNEILRGATDYKMALNTGEKGALPIHFSFDLFQVLNNSEVADLLTIAQDPFNSGALTVKIKPSFTIAGQQVKYPGYINVKY